MSELVSLRSDAEVSRWISIRRAVGAVVIPDGYPTTLELSEQVRLTQQLGDSFTVMNVRGQLFRISGDDADALGKDKPATSTLVTAGKSTDEQVWEVLRSCYDPEIPANIVDLGLIYGCDITALDDGTHKVQVRMTLTAPGCGMSGVLKQDIELKLSRLSGVSGVEVDLTFDPPWTQERMSEAAKLQLGFM